MPEDKGGNQGGSKSPQDSPAPGKPGDTGKQTGGSPQK